MVSILEFFTPKKETYYISDKFTVRQALKKFDAHKFSAVPIIDEFGKYVGTISEGDILRFIKNVDHFSLKLAETTKIKDIDRYRSYDPVRVDADINVLFDLSLNQNFIPVVDDTDTYMGIIKRSAILRFLFKETSETIK